LVTGRAYGLKISSPVAPHGMYFPFTPLPSPPSLLLSEKDVVDGIKQDVCRGRVKAKSADPGLPRSKTVKRVCIYL